MSTRLGTSPGARERARVLSGRWSIAAARLGYRALGVDPSINAVRSARRVAQQLNVDAAFIVADARYLPLAANTFDTVFSYSVLQHFAKSDVHQTLREIRRILTAHGGFFSLNPQAADLHLLPGGARIVVGASELLRGLADIVPPLKYVADSLYVRSRVAAA